MFTKITQKVNKYLLCYYAFSLYLHFHRSSSTMLNPPEHCHPIPFSKNKTQRWKFFNKNESHKPKLHYSEKWRHNNILFYHTIPLQIYTHKNYRNWNVIMILYKHLYVLADPSVQIVQKKYHLRVLIEKNTWILWK